MKTILLFLLVITYTCPSSKIHASNYQPGDTLSVFSLKGINLRENYGKSANILATLHLADQVIVVENFQDNKTYFETIDGLQGYWVKVLYDSIVAYAFDAYLSSLPIPSNLTTTQKTNQGKYYENAKLIFAFENYLQEKFLHFCEPLYYYNTTGGETTSTFLKLQKLNRDFTKSSTSGWEFQSTELLMPNIRLAEITNLIILLAQYSDISSPTLNKIISDVKKIKENNQFFYPIHSSEFLKINIKKYPTNNNQLNYSLEIILITG
ncbi:MAG TPA: hypothetical protein PK006_11330 [Saprospiraceae bacterium]|nr:hypothetical protein [Saprospiraceae bacterium]